MTDEQQMYIFTDFCGNRLLLHKSGENIMITCVDIGADMGGYSEVASVILDDLDAREVIKAIEQVVKGDSDA